jgi:hypothetical protein
VKRLVQLLLLIVLHAACTQATGDGTSTVKIGVLAYRPLPAIQARWRNFEKLLGERLDQYSFELELLANQELDDAVASRNLEFVLTNPGNYIYLKHRFGLSSPLITVVGDYRGNPMRAFGGVIFTRSERQDIQTLEDISRQRIATIGTVGLGGYLFQVYELHKAGLRLP